MQLVAFLTWYNWFVVNEPIDWNLLLVGFTHKDSVVFLFDVLILQFFGEVKLWKQTERQ